jgi:hypothetical protein
LRSLIDVDREKKRNVLDEKMHSPKKIWNSKQITYHSMKHDTKECGVLEHLEDEFKGTAEDKRKNIIRL